MESRDKDGEVRHAKMTQADFELVEVLANLMGRPLHQRDWAAVQLVADARAEWERKSATGPVAEWMIQHGCVTGHGDTLDDLLRALVAEVERKALERPLKLLARYAANDHAHKGGCDELTEEAESLLAELGGTNG